MKQFWDKYGKIIMTVLGLIGGYYAAVLQFSSHLDSLETKVDFIFETVKENLTRPVPSETNYKQWIKEVINDTIKEN